MVEREVIKDVIREIPIYPDPVYRPPSKPVKTPIPNILRSLLDIDPELYTDFEDNLYLYLAQNKLHSTKTAIQKVEMLAERCILLDSLLFKITTTPEKEMELLAIPEVCEDKMIMLYHSSLFAGHQGVIKTYLTIGDTFFIPGLIHIYVHILRDVIFVNYLERKSHLQDSYELEII